MNSLDFTTQIYYTTSRVFYRLSMANYFIQLSTKKNFIQTLIVTLNAVTCDPTFFKHDQPKGVWKKKLVWKDEWVKDHKTVKEVRKIYYDLNVI